MHCTPPRLHSHLRESENPSDVGDESTDTFILNSWMIVMSCSGLSGRTVCHWKSLSLIPGGNRMVGMQTVGQQPSGGKSVSLKSGGTARASQTYYRGDKTFLLPIHPILQPNPRLHPLCNGDYDRSLDGVLSSSYHTGKFHFLVTPAFGSCS